MNANPALPSAARLSADETGWRPDPPRAALLILGMRPASPDGAAPAGETLSAVSRNLRRLRQWAGEQAVPVLYADPVGDQQDAIPSEAVSLGPEAGDTVLPTRRYSAFHGTDLLARLQSAGRSQLWIAGAQADSDCMISAVDAHMRDLQAVLISDAVIAASEARRGLALDYVASHCGKTLDTDSLIGRADQSWMSGRVRQLIGDEGELDPEESLLAYGLDSLRMMQFAAELQARGMAIRFADLVRSPTLAAWLSLADASRRQAEDGSRVAPDL